MGSVYQREQTENYNILAQNEKKIKKAADIATVIGVLAILTSCVAIVVVLIA